jgi:ATP-independent RNA helicase DbpA
MQNSFDSLGLNSAILNNLKTLGYTNMTPIQQQALPVVLQNKDLIAQAKTGSGKTVAFSLGILDKLDVKKFRIQAMILTPTRELATQVASELKKLARFTHNIKITTLCGGMPYKPQVHSLSHQAHIVVGTPGRVLKHLKEESFSAEDIQTLVLDEADRMLDMGFYEDINEIISFLPKKRQTLLFSATYPLNIEQLAKDILIQPTKITIDTQHKKDNIKQLFYEISSLEKTDMVFKCLSNFEPQSTIIFCNTKIACDQLADDLEDMNVDVLVLHSDLDQKQRDETLILFDCKSYPVLIATDVAARGLDIDDIDLVINYDLPFDTQVYTHRIGRTARAGKEGVAISLVQEDQLELFEDLKQNISNDFSLEQSNNLLDNTKFDIESIWQVLFINGGKKNKMRAGDILGALTAGIGLKKEDVGKINILDFCSYVAVKRSLASDVQKKLSNSKIKGKYYRVFLK